MILGPPEEAVIHANLRNLPDLGRKSSMWGIVPSTSDALLAPYPEREVSRLMSLPVGEARRSWVPRLLAPPCLFPRELLASSFLTINFTNFHNLIFNLTLGRAGLKISFARRFAIKRSNTSTSISGSGIDTTTAVALGIDNRLLKPHWLQPLVITGQKAAR
jgi:hypothetical protein